MWNINNSIVYVKGFEKDGGRMTIFYTIPIIISLVFDRPILQIGPVSGGYEIFEIRRSATFLAVRSIMNKIFIFLLHALTGWALCGAVMGIGMKMLSLQNALLLHLFAAPLIFALVSLSYHRKAPSSRPVLVAAGFTAVVMAMDFFLVAWIIQKSFAMFGSFMGTWMPFAMIFISTWTTGRAMRKPRPSAKP